MSVKKQSPSSWKLYSLKKQMPENDKIDVHRYFNNNIFDISQCQHRLVLLSKGSQKKSFAMKLLQFCDLMTQQRYILQKEKIISNGELSSLVYSLR